MMVLESHRPVREGSMQMPRLATLSRPVELEQPPHRLLSSYHGPRLFWRDPGTGTARLGLGEAARWTAEGSGRFATLRDALNAALPVADSAGPRDLTRPFAMVGSSFFDVVRDARWRPFGAAMAVVPEATVTLNENSESWLTVSAEAGTEPERLVALWTQYAALLTRPPATDSDRNSVTNRSGMQWPEWAAIIADACGAIQRGELAKVVLARTLDIELAHDADQGAVVDRLLDRYADCYIYAYSPGGDALFAGATPELLIARHGRLAHTAALAGSRPRGATVEADIRLERELISSTKDRHEHQLVVDALRQRLLPAAVELCIEPTPVIRKLRTVQHLHTPVDIELRRADHVLDLVARLHPTPALGGWPSQPALDFIAMHEPEDRGWYASPIGIVEGEGDGVFAAAIRGALIHGSQARLFAGAGIVSQSDAEAEWAETDLKLRPMLSALTGTD